jgi:hypothetical protein
MTGRQAVIARCKQFQEFVYFEVAKGFAGLPAFHGKVVSIAYCAELQMQDLDLLYDKRHFNFLPSIMMANPPDPENTIPLGICMYIDRVPVAYAIGDICDQRQAFEVHFIETSNFFGHTGLKGWIRYLIDILIALREILVEKEGMDIRKICIVNPVESTIAPLIAMGFDFSHEYHKSDSAAILILPIDVQE